MERNRELVRNTVILAIGQFVPRLLGIATLPLLTACLSAEEFGRYDLVGTIVLLAVPVMLLQIQQAVFRELLAGGTQEDRQRVVTGAFAFGLAVSLPLNLLLFLGLWFVWGDLTGAASAALLLAAEALYQLVGQVVRGLGDNVSYSVGGIVCAVANVGLLFALRGWGLLGLWGAVLSMGGSYLLAGIYLFAAGRCPAYLRRQAFSRASLLAMLRYSVPLIPNTVSLWLVNFSNRLLIAGQLGSAANGIYAVAGKIPNALLGANAVFNLAWTETAARVADAGEGVAEYYSELFRRFFSFLTGAMLLLLAAAPVLFDLLVADDAYAQAYALTPVLALSAFFSCLVSFYGGIYVAARKTGAVGLSSALGAALNIFLCAVLLPRWGLPAAALGALVSNLLVYLQRRAGIQKSIPIGGAPRATAAGYAFLLVQSLLCLHRGPWFLAAGVALALLYNLLFNRYLLQLLAEGRKGKPV